MLWLLLAIFLGLGLIFNELVKIRKDVKHIMSTTDPLAPLQAEVAQEAADIASLQAADAKILADIKQLLANAVGAGQTSVSTAELTALLTSAQANDAAVQGVIAGDAAADAIANPPAPAPKPAS